MKQTTQKLSFQKKEFRILGTRELAHVKGGGGEMILTGGGELRASELGDK
jgi:hypothetical protein